MKRLLAVLAVVSVLGLGALALASAQEEKGDVPSHSHGMRAGMEGMMAGRGMEEMQRFMNSERMPQAMTAMMEMMSMMGQMSGGPMGGMMAPAPPSR